MKHEGIDPNNVARYWHTWSAPNPIKAEKKRLNKIETDAVGYAHIKKEGVL